MQWGGGADERPASDNKFRPRKKRLGKNRGGKSPGGDNGPLKKDEGEADATSRLSITWRQAREITRLTSVRKQGKGSTGRQEVKGNTVRRTRPSYKKGVRARGKLIGGETLWKR